jgi:hypothetical protein
MLPGDVGILSETHATAARRRSKPSSKRACIEDAAQIRGPHAFVMSLLRDCGGLGTHTLHPRSNRRQRVALGLPEAASLGAAFVLLKRGKELFWIAVGYGLLGSDLAVLRARAARPVSKLSHAQA